MILPARMLPYSTERWILCRSPKLFLANPDLPERFRRSAALNAPIPDTFYEGGEQGYVDYPTL